MTEQGLEKLERNFDQRVERLAEVKKEIEDKVMTVSKSTADSLLEQTGVKAL